MTILDANPPGWTSTQPLLDAAVHMEAVALALLGNPNPKETKGNNWRYGARGSLSIDLQKGVFTDHETGAGGGVLDLIQHKNGGSKAQAAQWLKDLTGQQAPEPRAKSKTVATYRYDDETGQHLFDVVRLEPKDFRQRAANGKWSVSGIRKVLYRLPKISAAPDGATVYLVEGEKDVDALEAAGLLATTNAGGAGKWSDDYCQSLKGKSVVILPDNDDAGRNHAATVKASLDKAGVDCAVLHLDGLPPKGDTTDWLAKGNTVADLEKLARGALQGPADQAANAKPGFHLIRSDHLEFKEPEYLVAGLVETETLSLLFADPGSGKSFIALDLAACVATGQPFHGRAVKQGAVIYICGEGKNGINRRLIAWDRHHGRSRVNAPLFISSMAAQFLSPEHIKLVMGTIDAAAQEAGSVALIIIDTLNRNMGAGDESSTADMTAFIAAVDEVKDRYDASVMVVHHSGHGNKERGRGSSAMLGALDAEYCVKKDGDTITMANTKMKDATPPPPIAFELVEVEVGTTRLGEPVTSAALTEIDPPERGATSLSANQRITMEALEQFIADNGQPTPSGTGWPETGTRKHVETAAFLKFLEGKMTADKPDSRVRTARRGLADVQAKGLVQTNAGSVWII